VKKEKRERLEKAGWRVGSVKEFLDLDEAESAVLEVRVALAQALKRRRLARHMSQAQLAKELGSSQSRVAKMEAGDPSVSLDLLMRSLFVTGSTAAELGKTIAKARAA
jgi:ribosome-binding protein aMBF1 (putative translation factor)